jgi:hypothetical protein
MGRERNIRQSNSDVLRLVLSIALNGKQFEPFLFKNSCSHIGTKSLGKGMLLG